MNTQFWLDMATTKFCNENPIIAITTPRAVIRDMICTEAIARIFKDKGWCE